MEFFRRYIQIENLEIPDDNLFKCFLIGMIDSSFSITKTKLYMSVHANKPAGWLGLLTKVSNRIRFHLISLEPTDTGV